MGACSLVLGLDVREDGLVTVVGEVEAAAVALGHVADSLEDVGPVDGIAIERDCLASEMVLGHALGDDVQLYWHDGRLVSRLSYIDMRRRLSEPRAYTYRFTGALGLMPQPQQSEVNLGEGFANELADAELVVHLLVDGHP